MGSLFKQPLQGELRKPLSDRVHNAIKERIAAFRFPRVKWKGGLRKTWHNDTEKAQTILARSLSKTFVDASSNHCGGALQDRNDWVWTVIVHFDKQINLDEFEDQMMRDPILIPRDEELDQQVLVTLLDSAEQHPPETESSQGTRVTYRFQAELSPI